VPDTAPRWTRHFISRVERTRTTWKLRVLLLSVPVIGLWLTSAWWTAAIGRGLVCQQHVVPSDAILIENFEPDYWLFERARALRAQGLAPAVLVPIRRDKSGSLNQVSQGVAELMARISRAGEVEFIPIREVEPISLNAARDVRRHLVQRGMRSVIVVTPLFRSRRSELVYRTTLTPLGITVHCEPVDGDVRPETWTQTWHGIQRVAEQWMKLLYYRLAVLPFRTNVDQDAARTTDMQG
jgi:hypothetical protein